MSREGAKTLQETLRELCVRGVLVLGYDGEELTYQVTEDFAQVLNRSNLDIMVRGGYGEDPVGEVSLLSIVRWCDPLSESDIIRLGEALKAVLIASQQGSP